jgi:hypothetical protein
MALSPAGSAGAFWEFTNDINAICAIQHCFRAVRYRRQLDGKGKAWLSGSRRWLAWLMFSANWQVAPVSRSDPSPNDINNPSAIHARLAILLD